MEIRAAHINIRLHVSWISPHYSGATGNLARMSKFKNFYIESDLCCHRFFNESDTQRGNREEFSFYRIEEGTIRMGLIFHSN